MIALTCRFEPNTAEVAAEVLDDEVILINLSTGIYYSMVRVATLIWGLIGQRYSIAEIVNMVSATYGVTPEQAHADAGALLEELLAERLILPATGTFLAEVSAPGEVRADYEAPQLDIFRDMSGMFAMDPPMPSLRTGAW